MKKQWFCHGFLGFLHIANIVRRPKNIEKSLQERCAENFSRNFCKKGVLGLACLTLGASGGIPVVSWAPLGRSGAPLGRSWAPLGHLLGALGRLLAGLGRSLGECCLSGAPRTSILRGFGSARGGFGTPSGAGWGRSVVNNGLTYALH